MNQNEQLVTDMLRAVEDRDPGRLLEIFAPDVEFVWPPSLPGYGGRFQGAEILDMQTRFAAAWDSLQPTAASRQLEHRIIASNDYEVVALYHQRGTDENGRSCETEVLALYRIVDGRVSRLQMFYFDPVQIAAFLTPSSPTDPAA